MRKSFRYVIYIVIGMLIYQMTDSEESSFSHQEARNILLIAIVAVFVLLVIVRTIKRRYDDEE